MLTNTTGGKKVQGWPGATDEMMELAHKLCDLIDGPCQVSAHTIGGPTIVVALTIEQARWLIAVLEDEALPLHTRLTAIETRAAELQVALEDSLRIWSHKTAPEEMPEPEREQYERLVAIYRSERLRQC